MQALSVQRPFPAEPPRLFPQSFFSPSTQAPKISSYSDGEAETSAAGLARYQHEHIARALVRSNYDEASVTSAIEAVQSTSPTATSDEAALMLMSSIAKILAPSDEWTDDQASLLSIIYQRSLGCLSSAGEPRVRASQALFALCRDLLRSKKPRFLSLTSELIVDRRLRGAQVRWLLRRTTWPLRTVAGQLSQTGSSVADKKQLKALLDQWSTAVQVLLVGGKLGIVNDAVSEETHTGAFVESALSYLTVLLAEHASSSSLLALVATVRDHAFHCQYVATVTAAQQESTDAVRAPSGFHRLRSPAVRQLSADEMNRPRSPYLPVHTVELALHHLMGRGQTRQAVDFLELIPAKGRSLRCYELLLERFGEGEAVGSGLKLIPPPPVGSMPFHNKIWQEALAFARSNAASPTAWLRLYEARMRSHALTGSVSLVIRDLRDLRRRGAFISERERSSSLSVFRHSAQIAVIKTFIRSRDWTGAKRLAEKLIVDSRRGQTAQSEVKTAHFETAVLNTLLRGFLDIFASLTSSNLPAFLATAQLEGFLREMDDLQVRLALPPDLITRNIILLALLRWDKGPSSAGLDMLRELLVRCGIFLDQHKSDNTRCNALSNASPSSGDNGADARHFLRFEASILRAVSRSFFERGMPRDGRRVIGVLKEAEKVAKAQLKPHERVWKKGRARLQGS